jgi:general secretion pathway protein K
MARDRSRERGIALLLVLWIFMILGVLALDFARYMRDDAMAAVNLADETRGYYLALAGLNRALYEAEQALAEESDGGGASPGSARVGAGGRSLEDDDDEDEDEDEDRGAGGGMSGGGLDGDDEEEGALGRLGPADGQWHEGEFAGGRFAVRMTDEGGRISLNTADEALLARVVRSLVRGGGATTGIDRRTEAAVEGVVDAILDWRDPDDLERMSGAESEYYLARRAPYRAKNGWFDSPEELLLVKGITPALLYGGPDSPGLRDIFSVYSREPKVNLRTAPAAVLQVLLDVDAAEAADLVAQREADPVGFLPLVKARLVAIDPGLAEEGEGIVDQAATTLRIEARADLNDERNQARVAAVVNLAPDASEGVRILRWLDRAPWEGGVPGNAPRPGEGA